MGLEKGAGVVGVRKGRLDQLVVGLVKRTLWLGHERECCKQPSWRQREEYDGFDKLPLGDARGDLVKSWTVKSFFWGGWARCRAGRFSNVGGVATRVYFTVETGLLPFHQSCTGSFSIIVISSKRERNLWDSWQVNFPFDAMRLA